MRNIEEMRQKYMEGRQRLMAGKRKTEPLLAYVGLPRVRMPEPPQPWLTQMRQRYKEIRRSLPIGINPATRKVVMKVLWRRNVRWDAVVSKERVHKLCLARHEICYRLYSQRRLSTTQIGRLIKVDHSSVIHGRNKYAIRIEMGLTDGPCEMIPRQRKSAPAE